MLMGHHLRHLRRRRPLRRPLRPRRLPVSPLPPRRRGRPSILRWLWYLIGATTDGRAGTGTAASQGAGVPSFHPLSMSSSGRPRNHHILSRASAASPRVGALGTRSPPSARRITRARSATVMHGGRAAATRAKRRTAICASTRRHGRTPSTQISRMRPLLLPLDLFTLCELLLLDPTVLTLCALFLGQVRLRVCQS